MTKNFKAILLGLTALILTLGLFACSQQGSSTTAKLDAPKFYDQETLAKYSELVNQGYAYLDNNQPDSAIASFEAMGALIPEGKSVEYNVACVYGRSADKDKAFEWMNKMVAKGWDNPNQLYEDTDFASLLDDPRFDEIAQKAEANRDANQAFISERIPELETAPQQFTSEEEYKAWSDDENNKLRAHSLVWFDSQYLKAKIDYSAQKLAALRELNKDNAEYDYGLVRVKEAASLKSPYECWGKSAQAVVKEADAYLAGTPSDSGAHYANFYAALALSLENCGEADAAKVASMKMANSYLDKITEDATLYGPAITLKLANNLDIAEDKSVFRDEVREVLPKYTGDRWVSRIVSTRFQDDAIRMLWPIKIDLKDIKGKSVRLKDYKGKVLLIDFWATWCPPCRAELPNIKEVYKNYNKEGFEILSISLDYEERVNLEAYRAWIAENGMNWRHIYDGKGWSADLVDDYYVSSIPAAFIMGKDGSIVASGDDCRGENLEESVKKALAM